MFLFVGLNWIDNLTIFFRLKSVGLIFYFILWTIKGWIFCFESCRREGTGLVFSSVKESLSIINSFKKGNKQIIAAAQDSINQLIIHLNSTFHSIFQINFLDADDHDSSFSAGGPTRWEPAAEQKRGNGILLHARLIREIWN